MAVELQTSTHLLPGEYVLVEVILYLFIGNVYTQLFKRILVKVLKSEYIQDAYREILIPATRSNTGIMQP